MYIFSFIHISYAARCLFGGTRESAQEWSGAPLAQRAGFSHVWAGSNRPTAVAEAPLGALRTLLLYTFGGGCRGSKQVTCVHTREPTTLDDLRIQGFEFGEGSMASRMVSSPGPGAARDAPAAAEAYT